MKFIVTTLILCLGLSAQSQTKPSEVERVPYGNNPSAGKYVKAGTPGCIMRSMGKVSRW